MVRVKVFQHKLFKFPHHGINNVPPIHFSLSNVFKPAQISLEHFSYKYPYFYSFVYNNDHLWGEVGDGDTS